MSKLNPQYRCIGKGFCGSVWTLENEPDMRVIKREDGGPGRSVTNDYNMHLCVLHSYSQLAPLSTPLLIPQCHALVQPTDHAWWEHRLQRFPASFLACRALISERIPKVPRLISDKIVDLFGAGNASLSEFVKHNPDDDACLIRPYLGRRRRRSASNTSRFQRFSLRNVPLHIDQMEPLNLEFTAYADTMADALAMMHWGAQIDANDVEFVLAPPRADPTPLTSFHSEYLGEHSMWLFDFDCCRHMSMDEVGIEQACAAFFRNDPYYPRPDGTDPSDQSLWHEFRERFLATSHLILGDNSPHLLLPGKLISRIEGEGVERQKRKQHSVPESSSS